MNRRQETGDRSQESGVRVGSRILIGLLVVSVGVFLTGCGGSSSKKSKSVTYDAIGVGVIVESKSNTNSNIIASKSVTADTARKKIDLAPGESGVQIRSAAIVKSSGVTAGTLTSNPAFILLAWDQVSGADHYLVYYNQTAVWDSDTVDTNADPAFVATSPQAYLDLDDEVSDITEPGQYRFQIVALSADDTVVYSFATVTASLGMVLGSFPEISFTSPKLSWSEVTGANEYRISFDEAAVATVDSSTSSYDVSQKLTASSTHYSVWVDARYLDSNGNLVEITRGIGGFSY